MRCLLILCTMLMGCSTLDLPFRGSESPLVYDATEVARADRIAILIPGALAPIEIFDPIKKWENQGYALVYYRFPGLDELPLDHKLGVENAASQIVAFANELSNKSIRLLGYSTGGPIAILAAQEIGGDVKVAAMSSAVEQGGGIRTTLRSTYDIFRAFLRARSLQRDRIWFAYYETLLFGRKGLHDEKEAIAGIVDVQKNNIVIPEGIMPSAHTDDLRSWKLERDPDIQDEMVRFFVGLEDPVFSFSQTQSFANNFGSPEIISYPGQGHLLFITHPEVYDDIFTFFEQHDS